MIYLKHLLPILLVNLMQLNTIFLFRYFDCVSCSFTQVILSIIIEAPLVHFFFIVQFFRPTLYSLIDLHKLKKAFISNIVHISIWLLEIVKQFFFSFLAVFNNDSNFVPEFFFDNFLKHS